MGSLVDEVSKATAGVGDVIKTLKEIGTLELLDRLSAIEELVETSLVERFVGEMGSHKKLTVLGFAALAITQLIILTVILVR